MGFVVDISDFPRQYTSHTFHTHIFIFILPLTLHSLMTDTVVKQAQEHEHSMPAFYLDAWLTVHSGPLPTAPIVQKAGL